MRTHILLAAAGLAALSLAACNKPAETTEAPAAGDMAADTAGTGAMAPADGAMAPADGAMAPSSGAMAPSETMTNDPMAMPQGATVPDATAAGQASGKTTPRPTIPADSVNATVPTRDNSPPQ